MPPLATALAFLLLAALFCAFALMDLGQMENLLAMVLQDRALSTLKALEKAAQLKYRGMGRWGNEAGFPEGAGLLAPEEEISLREILARSLLDLARHLDLEEQQKQLTAADLEKIAAEEGLLGIILLDAGGRVTCQTGVSLPRLQDLAAPLLSGQEEISLHLFEPSSFPGPLRFLALRRLAGQGAVFLVLGDQELQFWLWRMAVQEALREFTWDEGFAYLILAGPRSQILAQVGSSPEKILSPCRFLTSASLLPGLTAWQCTLAGGKRVLEFSAPFQPEGRNVGTFRIGLPTSATETLLDDSRRHIFIWTGVLMTLGLLTLVLFFSYQKRYLSRLQAMQARLHQAEHLSSLGKLAAGVAHEIRNPLNAISIALQRLKREFSPSDPQQAEEFHRLAQVVREEISRLNAIVEDFLSFTRGGQLAPKPQAIGGLFQKVLSLVEEEAKARGVHLQAEGDDSCPPVPMDLPKMQQVLLNLIKNALEAIAGEGAITLSAAPAGKDFLCLRVTDTGKGMSPEEQQAIFEPHYTTKEKGMGLGLALAYEIVRAHGGYIQVKSEPGRGSTFEIFLPLG